MATEASGLGKNLLVAAGAPVTDKFTGVLGGMRVRLLYMLPQIISAVQLIRSTVCPTTPHPARGRRVVYGVLVDHHSE